MFGIVLNTLMISAPQYKYKIKFSKGRSECCQRKQKRNKFDERNAGIWLRILSFIYSRQGTEATARNVITNETPVQVFSSQFCEMFKNALFIEYLCGVLRTSLEKQQKAKIIK